MQCIGVQLMVPGPVELHVQSTRLPELRAREVPGGGLQSSPDLCQNAAGTAGHAGVGKGLLIVQQVQYLKETTCIAWCARGSRELHLHGPASEKF